MTFRLGLTGSIGMGKSTAAGLFRAEGIDVWDADAAVHRMYGPGGQAVDAIFALCPQAIERGAVSRETLKHEIAARPDLLPQIEQIIHPLVASDRQMFLNDSLADIVVFDIPLLFEKGTETEMDATLLVTAPAALQRTRVLSRPGMTEQTFQIIMSRQMPDAEKRRRATHIVETLALDQTHAYIRALIAYIRMHHA
ncbi:dephospho-CoA kinase [Fuscibacter oryzae]|uniref:Dephospho-CoA kinase n=1 Tax=Fuscibacter oryzae TaxID=2803939 RepID=A0A8J7SV13_9RHOB|nr:dephospho-CoA kinase [Fuscibacter oryzae]MBL4929057.1 dephospho-CoA kinase [Fuscibacter oryzae]